MHAIHTWADPVIYEDPDILAIVQHLVGEDPVMCQLATDTPVRGSEYPSKTREKTERRKVSKIICYIL